MSDLSPEARDKIGVKLYSKIQEWFGYEPPRQPKRGWKQPGRPENLLDRTYIQDAFGKLPDSPVEKGDGNEKLNTFIVGKMTGMILAARTGKEIDELLSNREKLQSTILEAVRAVKGASKSGPSGGKRRKTRKQRKSKKSRRSTRKA